MNPGSGDTRRRKQEQLDVVLCDAVESDSGNGFEPYRFVHNALPGIRLKDVSLAASFLGWPLRVPLIIESMTGGAAGTEVINRNLAVAAERVGAAMCVGSQRAMLEDPGVAHTYQVRDAAPSVLLFGNIGAAQLGEYGEEAVRSLVRLVQADGLTIHLNPAQEAMQENGDTDWRGVLEHIAALCRSAEFPVMVKETGCGISEGVATRLATAGVAAIDVAGRGGTCWVRVEELLGRSAGRVPTGWGIPTAESLVRCRRTVTVPLVASGGMRTGLDCAKALALGADLVGIALPLLEPALASAEAVVEVLETVIEQIRTVMFLVGADSLERLRQVGVEKVR